MSPSRLPRITRPRLHRGHFAFLRGVLQGLSPQALWERYLSDQGEYVGPVVHRMTGWVRNELAATAARGGNFGRAHLLRLELAPHAASTVPSLETFVAASGLADFSETEQVEAYAAHYGTALSQDKRRLRLLHRQLFAVHTLEAQAASPIGLQDGCEAWLIDSLAARLARAGVRTLADLHARMCAHPDWWRDLRGIGVAKARALERFVAAHAETLGPLPDWETLAQGADADAQRPTAAPVAISPLVPLERIVLPHALSGQTGRYRADRTRCHLRAADDREAILAWLTTKAPIAAPNARLSHTQLAYRKEAERFLLWITLERRCALSSATVEDCVAYRDFLLAPPSPWCGPRAIPRWQVGWRPLEGPLSPRSCSYALSVLGNLFGFLVHQGYLIGNPWRAVTAPRRTPRGPDTGRGLTAAQWAYVREALDRLPAGLASQRLQIALPLLHDTGLRLAELLSATTDDLRWESWAEEGGRAEGWWLTVCGKGGKIREVPVSQMWVDAFTDYLAARGYGAGMQASSGVPLLGASRHVDAASAMAKDSVSGSAFHRQLKRFLASCAEQLAPTDAAAATRLRQASTHWMRHTHISHALAAGVPIDVVQQNVGHASLDTTSCYVRAEQHRRLTMMRRLWEQ